MSRGEDGTRSGGHTRGGTSMDKPRADSTGPRLSLSPHEGMTPALMRHGRTFGVACLIGTGVVIALAATRRGAGALGRDLSESLPIMLGSGLFFLGALGIYLSDIVRGSAAAVRGMLVGGISVGAWACWECGRVGNQFSIPLAIVGAPVGALAGAFFGGMLGVVGGWALRSLAGPVPEDEAPAPLGKDVRGRWLDG